MNNRWKPSVTVAALTSLASGVEPARHGLTEARLPSFARFRGLRPLPRDPVAAASLDAAAPPADKRLGTGHGQSETSVVRYANFERASSTPDEVIAIYYDSYRNLVAQGVIRDNARVARPHPFPGQFVPDPR